MTPSIVLLTLGVFVCGCQAPPKEVGAGEASDKGVAATVNGEPITLPDFHEHTDLKQTAQVLTAQGPSQTHVIGNFGLQSLQELVDQKVLMQLAKEQGVAPTDADIDAEIKLQTEIRNDYQSLLSQQGWSTERIRHEIAVGLAREHLIAKGVVVDQNEVDGYIKQHPEKFSDPARATLFFIQASTAEKKKAVDSLLAVKKPFSQVAVQLSEDPNAKATGGLYATKVVSSMPPRVQTIVGKLQPKQTSDWNTDRTTFVKFYLEDKVAAKLKPVTNAQKEMVRRMVALQKGEVKNNFTKLFYDKLKSSKVEVQVPYLQDQWKKTWDQLSEPSGQNPPSSASGQKPK